MADTQEEKVSADHSIAYQIRIKGHLGPEWSDWFDGMSVVLESNGESLVSGDVVDQSELHSLLRKIRDLGLPLISVTRLGSDQNVAPDGFNPLIGRVG